MFQAARLDRDRDISASLVEARGSSSGGASQGRNKEHPGQSRKAPPRSRSNGEAWSSVEDTPEGATMSSTASTTAIISKEIGFEDKKELVNQ